MRRVPCLAMALLLATACQTMQAPAPPPPREATAVNASFGRTWDAAIEAFAALGISIASADRSSGLLVPAGRSYKEDERSLALQNADCGANLIDYPNVPASVRYNVLVRGDSVRSTVQVRAFYQPGGSGETCESRGQLEQQTEATIKARAESPGRP